MLGVASMVIGLFPKTAPGPGVPVGADWKAFVLQDQRIPVVLNVGGEGENAMAYNLNDFSYLMRDEVWDPAWGPVIKSPYERLPIKSKCLDQVVGNRLPGQADPMLQRMADEAYRTLKPGGTIKLWSTSAPGSFWIDYLKKAGFSDVRVEGQYAVGRKS